MNNLYALAFLYHGNSVLLLERQNTTFANGLFGLVGGKVEQGESVLAALVREVKEEVGLTIPEDSFELMHTMHRKGTESEFIACCFMASLAGMAPELREPDKCSRMIMGDIENLPENIIPAHKQIIECIIAAVPYSEHGW